MDTGYLILKFLVGGGIIVGVTLLAQQVDPKYGGILAAAPITTTLAFLFTYAESGQETTRDLVISAFWFALPSLVCIILLWYLMARYPFVPSLCAALGAWLVAVLVVNRALARI